LETSITTAAPSSTSARPSPVSVLTPVFGAAAHHLVAVFVEFADDLRADQSGAAGLLEFPDTFSRAG